MFKYFARLSIITESGEFGTPMVHIYIEVHISQHAGLVTFDEIQSITLYSLNQVSVRKLVFNKIHLTMYKISNKMRGNLTLYIVEISLEINSVKIFHNPTNVY